MERANTVFTKVQRDDGTWTRRLLARLPKAPKKSNRALGICRPLMMCFFFAQSAQMKQQLDSVLTPYGKVAVAGATYSGVVWDVRSMVSTVIQSAHAFDYLRALQPENPALAARRMQLQFAGMGWTLGKGCTRLVV
eukprot:6193364-Pleurochrysis_carterae.AAC.2